MPTPANSRQGVDLSRRTWTAWLEKNALHIGLVSDGTYKNKKHINSIGGRANQDNMVLLSVTTDSGACRELCSDLLLRFRRFVPKVMAELYEERCTEMPTQQLFERCASLFDGISASEAQSRDVDKITRAQSVSKKWYQFPAGRVTTSRM